MLRAISADTSGDAQRRSRLPGSLRLGAILAGVPDLERAEGARLLLTVENAADPLLPSLPGWACYRIPAGVRPRPGCQPGATASLPFADATFEAVCVYGALLQGLRQPRLLNMVRRSLRPGGTVAVVEPLASFSFTTFPIGGPAHLLRRQLLQAGFARVRGLPGDADVLVLLAERAPAPTAS